MVATPRAVAGIVRPKQTEIAQGLSLRSSHAVSRETAQAGGVEATGHELGPALAKRRTAEVLKPKTLIERTYMAALPPVDRSESFD